LTVLRCKANDRLVWRSCANGCKNEAALAPSKTPWV